MCNLKYFESNCREENEEWIEETKLEGHSDWVKDVAWSPLAGVTKMTIASCSQDKRVIIWSNRETDGIIWAPELLKVFDDVVYHVSWNEIRSILAVSGGDSEEEVRHFKYLYSFYKEVEISFK